MDSRPTPTALEGNIQHVSLIHRENGFVSFQVIGAAVIAGQFLRLHPLLYAFLARSPEAHASRLPCYSPTCRVKLSEKGVVAC